MKNSSVTGAAFLLAVASLGSRATAILRDRLFAHLFGAGDTLDAYYAAFRLPDTIYTLIVVGALSAGFIPIFIAASKKDEATAWRLTNNVITTLTIIMLVIVAGIFLTANWLVPHIVPGFSAEKLTLTIRLTRLMLLSPILLGLSAVVSSVLQSKKRLLAYALAPIFYNFGIIIGAAIFYPIFGINGLAFGVVLGASAHLLTQLPALSKIGWRFRPVFDLKDNLLKRVGQLMIPRTLGLATHQINWFFMTMFASTVGSGSLTIFILAENIQSAPAAIIGISFAVAAFPILSAAALETNRDHLRQEITVITRQIIFLILPLSILIILLHSQIVRVLLGTGRFDWNNTIATSNALVFFSFSLFAQCLTPLLTRAFYALEDSKTPFIIGTIGVLINIILGYKLKNTYGISGLALAYSLSYIIQVALLFVTLRHKISGFAEHSFLLHLAKLSLSGMLMGIVVQYLKTPLAQIVDMTRFWGIATQGIVAGAVGLFIYGVVCACLRVEELDWLKSAFSRRFLKLDNNQISLNERIND